jgi:hypothetical protein
MLAGVPEEVEAFENECIDRYPPDQDDSHEGFTDGQGRLVRRWTSNGRRIEAIISTAPKVALVSLGVLDQ